jgi:hypothetical protein
MITTTFIYLYIIIAKDSERRISMRLSLTQENLSGRFSAWTNSFYPNEPAGII